MDGEFSKFSQSNGSGRVYDTSYSIGPVEGDDDDGADGGGDDDEGGDDMYTGQYLLYH